MRILIVKLSAIGDCVLTLPVLHRLRQWYPEAHLAWLVEDRCHSLLQGHPELDELIVVKRRSCRGFRDRVGMAAGLVRQIKARKFDLAIDFQGLFKSSWSPRMAGIPRRVGYQDGREGSRLFYTERFDLPKASMHAVDRYLALLDRTLEREPSGPAGPDEFILPRHAESEGAVADWLGEDERYAVINISAGKPANRWMPERFGSLAAELKMPVVLSGGPGDAELAEAVRRSAGDAPTRIACGRFDLRGLVALLRGAALVVSGDSGPMHIANALGTPLVTLFGSSEPKRTGPYLERQTTLLMHRVDCAPCFKMRCPNPPDSFLACLEKISVEEVLAAAGAML